MQTNSVFLINCPLFAGIKLGELDNLISCLGGRKKKYPKDAYIFMADETPRNFGIVLSGSVLVVQDNFWGNRSILERIESNGLFGAAFALGGFEKLPVSVIAAEDSEVYLIDGSRITQTCQSACTFHNRLIRNLMGNLAKRNALLIQKMEHITQRTTREKLLSYLSSQALEHKSNSFEIPFDRQELADYLSLDRSAMSSELGHMRDEGLLSFHKNQFTLNKRGME
ncbi:MAG: Crp/Fnr family transcriptional regulator [Treponema sp.]|jgi:CRP-like cAMP-binding protein|nr:Crp/Fnr family transcriptional regulator [Treponema sp.]